MSKPDKNGKPSVAWRTFSPGDAQALLDTKAPNRALSPNRVRAMADDMNQGRWVLNGEAIKIAKSGALIDGQHRLAAAVKAGKPLTTLVIEDLPDAMIHTIDQGKSRTHTDVLAILGIPNSVNASTISRALWELERFQVMGTRVYPPRSEIIKTYKKHADTIQEALNTVRTTAIVRSKVAPVNVLAVWYLLAAQKNETKAREFLTVLEAQESPIAQMVYKRMNSNSSNHVGPFHHRVAIVIKAWNYWLHGSTPANLYFRSNEAFPDVEG